VPRDPSALLAPDLASGRGRQPAAQDRPAAARRARELNPKATIVAAVREEENVHLLHQGGADGVVTSSAAAGRLLGLSSETPQVTEVLEDILTVGGGLDIVEHEVGASEAGPVGGLADHGMLLAVVRDGELIRFDDERARSLLEGDRLVELRGGGSHAGA
jgi:voltage-gated potassium channel